MARLDDGPVTEEKSYRDTEERPQDLREGMKR